MSDEKKAIITYRLTCSDETMSDAQALVGEGRWRSAVNQLYYAVFQAVSALMIKESIRIKSHSGAKAMLELHFIKTGYIDRIWGGSVMICRTVEKKAIKESTEDDVLLLLPQTQEFIDVIKRLINTN